MTGLYIDKRFMKLAFGVTAITQLAALATAACQRPEHDEDVGSAVAAETSQVKPAATPSPKDPDVLASPEQEAAELPRGVSAPQPDARDREAPRAAVAKPSTPSPAVKPSAPAPASKPTVPAVAPPKPSAPSTAAKTSTAATKAPPPAAPKPPPAVPAAPIAAPPPAPAPKKISVLVPQTDHVRVEVPAGLQHWLDEDDRMRPWLGKAVNVADSCYAKVRADDPGAAGDIAFVVTMHENARPSGKVSSVSSPVSGIVMCATTRLLGVKMPLFTGDEGASYTVRVRFSP